MMLLLWWGAMLRAWSDRIRWGLDWRHPLIEIRMAWKAKP